MQQSSSQSATPAPTTTTTSARATLSEVEAQAKQLSHAARDMSQAVEGIVEWSRQRVDRAVANHEVRSDLEGVAAKLIVHRAGEVAAQGASYLTLVDSLKQGMSDANKLLTDVRKASRQLHGLEQLLSTMEQAEQQKAAAAHQQQQAPHSSHHVAPSPNPSRG